MDAPAISAASLRQSLASARPPLVIDVRKNERFQDAANLIRGALYRWCKEGKAAVHTWNPEAYR